MTRKLEKERVDIMKKRKVYRLKRNVEFALWAMFFTAIIFGGLYISYLRAEAGRSRTANEQNQQIIL